MAAIFLSFLVEFFIDVNTLSKQNILQVCDEIRRDTLSLKEMMTGAHVTSKLVTGLVARSRLLVSEIYGNYIRDG